MEARTFVKLIKLVDITYEGDTEAQRERWKANVLNSVGEDAYGLDIDNDYITKDFTTDEIEFASVDCYNFMGSEYEQERFYAANWITVVEKATGDYYAYETEEIRDGGF